MRDFLVRWFSITVVSAGFLAAQVSPMKQALQPPPTAPQPQPQPPTAQPPNAQQAKPATPGAPGAPPAVTAPAGATTTPVTTPVTPGLLSNTDAFSVDDVPLGQMIEILAKHLKLNYILDPRIPAGRVTLHTYGEFKPVDYMPLLHTILRMNGAAMVQVGDLYRIVPTAAVAQLPINPITNADPKTLPDDERIILNMVFLKYSTAPEMDKMLTPFLSEGGKTSVYESANLLLIQDNSRSMKRLMDLINRSE